MPYTQQLKNLHAAFLDNAIECKQYAPLSSHTTFHIGGPASLTAWPSSRTELIQVLSLWREVGDSCPICVIGNSSMSYFPIKAITASWSSPADPIALYLRRTKHKAERSSETIISTARPTPNAVLL